MPKIFLSWSGEPSRECAEVLRSWLPLFNASIKPFVSSQDIRKGDRGLQEISEQLKGSSFGIVCVTAANQWASWINFEAGALSRQVKENMLIPFLLDIPVRDIEGPLKQFQMVTSDNKEDVLAMVKSINRDCEPKTSEAHIEELFEFLWLKLRNQLSEIDLSLGAGEEKAQPRRTEEILDELVPLVREQINRISDLEKEMRRVSRSALVLPAPSGPQGPALNSQYVITSRPEQKNVPKPGTPPPMRGFLIDEDDS